MSLATTPVVPLPATTGDGTHPGALRVRRGRGAPRAAVVALAVLLLVSLALALVPVLAPHGESERIGAPFQHVLSTGLLGTDSQGRDLLSRVLFGMRASWFGAMAVIAIGVVVGGLVGLLAGFAGGIVDTVLMRLTDAALALPATLVALMAVAALGPSLRHTLIAVGVTWWPWYARIVRGQVQVVRRQPHVDAARLGGLPGWRVAVLHVLPGTLGPVVVAASLDVGAVILVLSGLSFLGLGSPPPAAELGGMSAQGLTYLFNAPWVALTPAVAIFALSVLANFAGDGLREMFSS